MTRVAFNGTKYRVSGTVLTAVVSGGRGHGKGKGRNMWGGGAGAHHYGGGYGRLWEL